MLDLDLAAIGSFRGWIVWKGRGLAEPIRDLVRVAMGSWSPLYLAATWVFLEIVSGCCWDAAWEVVTLSLPWTPLEVGSGYRSGANACSGTTVLGCGPNLGDSGDKDFTVRQFAKIFRTALIYTSCESHMLVGKSLRAAEKKCMALVILSSIVT